MTGASLLSDFAAGFVGGVFGTLGVQMLGFEYGEWRAKRLARARRIEMSRIVGGQIEAQLEKAMGQGPSNQQARRGHVDGTGARLRP